MFRFEYDKVEKLSLSIPFRIPEAFQRSSQLYTPSRTFNSFPDSRGGELLVENVDFQAFNSFPDSREKSRREQARDEGFQFLSGFQCDIRDLERERELSELSIPFRIPADMFASVNELDSMPFNSFPDSRTGCRGIYSVGGCMLSIPFRIPDGALRRHGADRPSTFQFLSGFQHSTNSDICAYTSTAFNSFPDSSSVVERYSFV